MISLPDNSKIVLTENQSVVTIVDSQNREIVRFVAFPIITTQVNWDTIKLNK